MLYMYIQGGSLPVISGVKIPTTRVITAVYIGPLVHPTRCLEAPDLGAKAKVTMIFRKPCSVHREGWLILFMKKTCSKPFFLRYSSFVCLSLSLYFSGCGVAFSEVFSNIICAAESYQFKGFPRTNLRQKVPPTTKGRAEIHMYILYINYLYIDAS